MQSIPQFPPMLSWMRGQDPSHPLMEKQKWQETINGNWRDCANQSKLNNTTKPKNAKKKLKIKKKLVRTQMGPALRPPSGQSRAWSLNRIERL